MLAASCPDPVASCYVGRMLCLPLLAAQIRTSGRRRRRRRLYGRIRSYCTFLIASCSDTDERKDLYNFVEEAQ